MDGGTFLRKGFEQLFQQLASTVLVHKKWGTVEQSTIEVRGMKNHKKDHPEDIMFNFLEDPGIVAGDVLQQKGARDLWRVTETHDKIISDVYHSFTARVEATNTAAKSFPASSGRQTVVIHGHVLGGIQMNSPGAVQNNDVAMNRIANDIGELNKLFSASGLSDLDKEEAAHALHRVAELSARPKSPDLLAKIGQRIDELKDIASSSSSLLVTATPMLTGLWDKIQSMLPTS